MRLPKGKKLELARNLADQVKARLQDCGRFERFDNYNCYLHRGDLGSLSFSYSTPFSRLPGLDGYIVDIWFEHKKVFSLRWPPEKIVAFRYGEWMNQLIPGSYVEAPKVIRRPARSQDHGTVFLLRIPDNPGAVVGPWQWQRHPETGKLFLAPRDPEPD